MSADPVVVVVGFERDLAAEQRSLAQDAVELDVGALRGSRYACDEASRQTLRRLFAALPAPAIALLGPGEYHYATRLLLERFTGPFTLVLFDQHADDLRGDASETASATSGPCMRAVDPGTGEPGIDADDLLRCDGWVPLPGEIPALERIAWIGGEPETLGHALTRWGRRACIVPRTRPAHRGFAQRLGSGSAVELLDPFDSPHLTRVTGDLVAWLDSADVYLSIDKDVLDVSCAATRWSQGTMTLAELRILVGAIARSARLVGADVVGDLPDAPDRVLDPRWRLGRAQNRDADRALLRELFGGRRGGRDR